MYSFSWEGLLMGQTDLSDYKNIYLQTAKEYIDKILVSLNKLSGNPSDREALNDLHISSHSLKSQSQVMNYADMASICSAIERVSSDALQGITQLNNETILNIKKEAEELGRILKRIQDGSGIKI